MLHKMIRVLVAVSNAAAREMIRNGINVHRDKRYIEIDVAGNGSDALQVLNKKPIDIAFIDLNMSDQNGCEVVAAIPGSKSANCLTVAMSSSLDNQSKATLQRSGAYHFLQKPFRPDEVSDIIATYTMMTESCPILIVDDSAIMRKITRKILEGSRFNFEISETDNAQSALRMLASGKFKIVLTDFHMPGVDGLELAGTIQDMSSKISIYMMSTNDTSYLERSAAFIGISGFLKKPFTTEDVDTLLHQHFSMERPAFGKERETFSFLKKTNEVG